SREHAVVRIASAIVLLSSWRATGRFYQGDQEARGTTPSRKSQGYALTDLLGGAMHSSKAEASVERSFPAPGRRVFPDGSAWLGHLCTRPSRTWPHTPPEGFAFLWTPPEKR